MLAHLLVAEFQSSSAFCTVVNGLTERFAFDELFSGDDVESENFHGSLLKCHLCNDTFLIGKIRFNLRQKCTMTYGLNSALRPVFIVSKPRSRYNLAL